MLSYRDELATIEATFVELEQNIGLDLRHELLSVYFVTQDECLREIGHAIHQGQAAPIVVAAHKLKGAAAQLGAKQMSATCARLEQVARSGSLEGVEQDWQHLADLGVQLGDALRPASATNP